MTSKEFYPQLEGLRGVAILLVVISHFIINPHFPNLIFLKLGAWGVNLFFVLSGFLISEILMKEIYSGTKSANEILKMFYIKRILRIFPIYYITIVILALFRIDQTEAILPYTLTYTYNIGRIWFNINGGVLMHFWSLCVEEQFYMFWPLLLIIIHPSKYRHLIIGLIVSSILIKIYYYKIEGYNFLDFNLAFTPTSFECLGMGALLAYFKLNHFDALKKILRYYLAAMLLAVMFFVIMYKGSESSLFYQGFARLIYGLVGFFLVGLGALSVKTVYGGIISNRLLRFLGKISYGIYIYHWIIYYLLKDWFFGMWVKLEFGPFSILKFHGYIFSFLFFFCFTVVISIFSFYFIERPLLKYKNSFKFAF